MIDLVPRVGGFLLSIGGTAAAAEAVTGSTLTGIAAIITAVSGLVAAVGGVWIGLRKRNEADERMAKLFEKMIDKMEKDDGDDEPA